MTGAGADDLLRRCSMVLAGLWGGFMLALGAVAAPTLFAGLDRAQAGVLAGRLFHVEAYASLAVAVILIMIERRRTRLRIGDSDDSGFDPAASGVPQISPDLLLLLAALFCTVLGYFGLQPVMSAARSGPALLSFGAAHGLSMALFALKGVLVLVFAWRAARA